MGDDGPAGESGLSDEARSVSCRLFTFFWEWLDEHGMSVEEFLAGMPRPASFYRSPFNWTSMETLIEIERRFSARFPDVPDLFFELGRSLPRTRGFGFVRTVAGGVFSPYQVYMRFPALVPTFLLRTVHIDANREGTRRVRLDYRFDGRVAPTAAFIDSIRGILTGVPGFLGLPDAAVSVRALDPFRYSFDIDLTAHRGLVDRLVDAVRTFVYFFQKRNENLDEAHRAVVEANRLLQDTVDELVDAKSELDDRVRDLSVLNSLATAATLELDPARAARESALVLSTSFGGAPVVVLLVEGEPPALVIAGAANADNEAASHFLGLADNTDPRVAALLAADGPVDFQAGGRDWQLTPLVCRSRRIGLLGFGIPQNVELVLAIAAQLSVALDNAHSHQHLADLRAHLELRVRERTAELEDARTQLENTVVELRRSDQAKTEFFTNLSHDLATPLTLVLASLETLQARVPDELQRDAAAIRKNALHLSRLITDLLDLARIESGKLPIDRQRVDLGLLAADVVETLRPNAERNAISLAFETPREPLVVPEGDPKLLRRVLVNLVSNAIKYVGQGDHVVVCGSVRGGELRLDVIDDGPGIPWAEQNRVFERFYRTARPDARVVEGTGLGLPLSRQIAQAHGGDIELESTPGRGCRFRLRLPRTSLPAQPAPEAAPISATEAALAAELLVSPESGVVPSVAAPTRVLVVEDNPEMREYVARIVGTAHRVLTAHDGAEALGIARQEQPDAIVTDLTMPDMDGLQLCRALREDMMTRHVPIILLTAHHDAESAVAGLNAGADDFVRKPFSGTELLARIAAQIRIRNLALTLMRMEKRTTLGMLGGGIAHEVLNPLNALMNLLDPLNGVIDRALRGEADEGDREEGPRMMMTIEIAAARIQKVVEALSRFTRQNESLRIREVDLSDGIETVLALLAWRMGDRVLVHKDYRFRGPLPCAPELVDQVVMNLVVNAIDAMDGRGEIWISVDQVGDRCEVRVKDSGPGVPVDLRERIFAPFFTTKDPGKGTGLGLAISREIATLHGGSLELARGPGGAEFILSLPLTTTAQDVPNPTTSGMGAMESFYQ